MNTLDEFFADGTLKSYIGKHIQDGWNGTHFEGYLKLSPRNMGVFGEKLVSKIMIERFGSVVCASTNTSHDRIIDGYKTEIKFSLSKNKDSFIFNHIACHKDWDRLILLGVNPENHFHMNWITKADFAEHIKSEKCLFNHQQGGKNGNNDDFMYTGNYIKLKNTGLLNEMNAWITDGVNKMGVESWL